MSETCPIAFDLIVTIVNRGFAEEVMAATKGAGSEGGTILNGRGTGIHENAKLFGISIEPEKEIVLSLVDNAITNQVLDAVTTALELDKPGKGVAFVLAVDKVVGICHLIKN